MIRFGVHCSLRNGLPGALEEARDLGCEAIQIFTRSPRMWRMQPPSPEDAAAFRELRSRLAIRPLVVHTPYLPNLATSQEKLYDLSLDSMRKDLAVAESIEADYLVIHPGSYSPGSSPEEGIARIAGALDRALADVPGKTTVLLENVSGGGRRLGGSFGELARMMDGVPRRERIAVCLDTAHAFGAGYDLSTAGGVDAMLEEFDRVLGMSSLRVIHFNDSLAPRDSRKDRHQHLGKGYIGDEGFSRLVDRVKGTVDAGILETPKDAPGADRGNLARLFSWRDCRLRGRKDRRAAAEGAFDNGG